MWSWATGPPRTNGPPRGRGCTRSPPSTAAEHAPALGRSGRYADVPTGLRPPPRPSTGTGPLLLLVGGLVFLLPHRFEPRGGVAAVGKAFEHGEVAHEGVAGGAMPVVLVGWADDRVAGTDAQDRAVSGTDESDAFGDVQGLADGVAGPVGVGAPGGPGGGDGPP